MATITLNPTRRKLLQAHEIVVADYPALKEICWNYYLPTIPADEAFSRYETAWRHVDVENLAQKERQLIADLTQAFGNGYFLG